MIYVGGVPFLDDCSSSSLSSSSQGSSLLLSLIRHPLLVSASDCFKNFEERKVSFEECGSERSTKGRYVYLFQREYATVDPTLVDFAGTDEATTCVGLVIRNRKSGMTSLAHMDSPKVVDGGISQMLSLVLDPNFETELDVHMIGGFEDIAIKHANDGEQHAKPEGYSFPLCCKLVETLQKRQESFHIQTLCILEHNTMYDAQGIAKPVFNGCLVETSTGSVFPASFDRSSRCPDEIVRRIRVLVSCQDSNSDGTLLDTYDTKTDRFVIAPCYWTVRLIQIAWSLSQLPDEEILRICSTSPSAEGPDFLENERRVWDYLLKFPDWNKTFPMRQPRLFERSADGDWKRC